MKYFLKWWYFPRALARGKYHHWRKYFTESPERRVYKWYIIPKIRMIQLSLCHFFIQTFDVLFSILYMFKRSVECQNSMFGRSLLFKESLFSKIRVFSSSELNLMKYHRLQLPPCFNCLWCARASRVQALPWQREICLYLTLKVRYRHISPLKWDTWRNHLITW